MMDRRRFLIAGTAAAAAPWLICSGTGRTADGLDVLGASKAGPLSVGYIEGSAGARDLTPGLAGAKVVPAAALPAGDAALRQGALRVGVRGLTPGLEAGSHPAIERVYVDALVPHPDPGNSAVVPFFAWTLQRGAVEQRSNPVSFTVPGDRQPRIGFSLDVHGTEPSTAVFTGGRGDNLAKVRPGLFLLALFPGVWDQPAPLPALDDASAWSRSASVVVAIDRG